MSKAKTLRVVPFSNIMTLDSVERREGVAFDLGSDEAERLIASGHVFEVLKGEVEPGATVAVKVEPAPAEPGPPPVPTPEPVEVILPPAPETPAKP